MRTFLQIFIALIFAANVANAQDEPTVEASEEILSVDEQISRHVMGQADEERKKRMKFMGFVIDDIVRLCELDEAQKSRLTLAAKGAAKRSMESWNHQADRYYRQRVSGSDEDTVSEMLKNMGTVNFGGRNSDREGEVEAVWEESLKAVLTDPQIKRYESVLADRKQARIDAFAQMSLAALDNFLRLTPNQKQKMGDIVSHSANEYLDDINRYWGDMGEKSMLMSLANAAEEETLRGILSIEQYDLLQSTTSNFEHFWEQRRRLKKAKIEAIERKKAKADAKPAQPKALGKIRIKAGKGGAVVIQKGAVFRGGQIEINADQFIIEE